MKHLPNELLYLLKIYNYITDDIGLNRARSHAEDIRAYIAKADYLYDHPGIREYLSEEKSIDDIITYIQRNQKTYSLLSEWKDGEAFRLFSSKGVGYYLNGICDGGFSLSVSEDKKSLCLTLKTDTFADQKIVFQNAVPCQNITVDSKVLWFEFYRTADAMCFEVFCENLDTVKIVFSDFDCQKVFGSAVDIMDNNASTIDNCFSASTLIFEKHIYDPSLLNEKEKALLPYVELLYSIQKGCIHIPDSSSLDHFFMLFNKHGIKKGEKLISVMKSTDNKKKADRLKKRISACLISKKSIPLIRELYESIIASQN